jgi:hypothetical protein
MLGALVWEPFSPCAGHLYPVIWAGWARLSLNPARVGEWRTAHLSPCGVRVFLSATILAEVAESPTGQPTTESIPHQETPCGKLFDDVLVGQVSNLPGAMAGWKPAPRTLAFTVKLA